MQRVPNMNSSFMARAIQLSIENVRSAQGGPFGALVVENGRIIAEGVNQVTLTNDPTAHAEVLAIRRACEKLRLFELKSCELYTSCEPCPMCLGAIYWARPARIFFSGTHKDAAEFGFDDSFIYSQLRQSSSERQISATQIMREEALAAFRVWMEKPDKVPY